MTVHSLIRGSLDNRAQETMEETVEELLALSQSRGEYTGIGVDQIGQAAEMVNTIQPLTKWVAMHLRLTARMQRAWCMISATPVADRIMLAMRVRERAVSPHVIRRWHIVLYSIRLSPERKSIWS